MTSSTNLGVHTTVTALDSDLLVWQLIPRTACLPVEVLMVRLSATVRVCAIVIVFTQAS